MSRRHWRVMLAAGASTSLLGGLAVAGSGAATAPETTVPTPATAVAAPGTSATDTTTPETPAVEILPPGEPYAGVTVGEWDARWWQWAVSLPPAMNPNIDPTGEQCGFGQSGPVFFVPGYFGEPTDGGLPHRTCTVAEGTAIYIGTIGAECSTVEPPPYFGRDEAELRACAETATDAVVDVGASINGQDVGDLTAYRVSSPLFTLNFPADNVFGAAPGVAEAVSDSYSFIIAPPTPGEYEIELTAQFAAGLRCHR